MLRAVLLVLCGIAVGAGGALLILQGPGPHETGAAVVPPQQISCESELTAQRSRIAELEKRISLQQQPGADPINADTEQSKHTPDTSVQDRAIAWRVSAIEKFVPLSEDQRGRLENKFKAEQAARAENRDSSAETLEEIIGEEPATTYRQQVKAAFERAQNQELDKEAVWVAHKLSLTPEQQRSMRTIFSDVEAQIDKEFADQQHGVAMSPQQRVTRMVAENKRRIQLRSDALKQVLRPEQYSAYIQEESQSAAADVEIFHDAPGDE